MGTQRFPPRLLTPRRSLKRKFYCSGALLHYIPTWKVKTYCSTAGGRWHFRPFISLFRYRVTRPHSWRLIAFKAFLLKAPRLSACGECLPSQCGFYSYTRDIFLLVILSGCIASSPFPRRQTGSRS